MRSGAARAARSRSAWPIAGGGLRSVGQRHGIGIPEHVDITDTGTLGLQLVTLLADQLQRHRRRSVAPEPTRFDLRFPIGRRGAP